MSIIENKNPDTSQKKLAEELSKKFEIFNLGLNLKNFKISIKKNKFKKFTQNNIFLGLHNYPRV